MRGQHQWAMTPRPIKQFIWAVPGDVGTFRKGGRGKNEGGSERMKGERMKIAIEINGHEKEKPQKVSSLNKLYYESQYGITRICGHAEHHDQMEENADCVTNPSRLAEFLKATNSGKTC